jgi:hypothetical protein
MMIVCISAECLCPYVLLHLVQLLLSLFVQLREVYSNELRAKNSEVKVGSLLPNTMTDISVQLIAPQDNGNAGLLACSIVSF